MTRSDVLAGAGLGALVGCLLGFSTQSVIGGGVAAVLTLVTGIVGVSRPTFLAATTTDGDPNTRLLSFGVTATLFFLASYTIAIGRYLEPNAPQRVRDLVCAGYDQTTAMALIATKDYAVSIDGWEKLTSKRQAAVAVPC